jgi:hypothetical protein
MLIEAGIQGFQGFQPECNVHIEEIAGKRTKEGEELIILGPLSVVSELPVLNPDEIRQKVRYYKGICEGKARLAVFVSNIIGPDTPLENIIAMHDEAVNG